MSGNLWMFSDMLDGLNFAVGNADSVYRCVNLTLQKATIIIIAM